MQVREIMTRDVDWVAPDTTVQDAARRMRDENIGALPVGENDKLIGMVTDRDIVVRLLPEGRDISSATVKDAMSDKLLYCFDDQNIEEVADNMGEHHVRRLPVVNREKRLVGMISLGDIARSGAEQPAGHALGEAAQPRV
ncbi:MAG: CBS domain-containing protein [Alphaproteobacteria bacterium]